MKRCTELEAVREKWKAWTRGLADLAKAVFETLTILKNDSFISSSNLTAHPVFYAANLGKQKDSVILYYRLCKILK